MFYRHTLSLTAMQLICCIRHAEVKKPQILCSKYEAGVRQVSSKLGSVPSRVFRFQGSETVKRCYPSAGWFWMNGFTWKFSIAQIFLF